MHRRHAGRCPTHAVDATIGCRRPLALLHYCTIALLHYCTATAVAAADGRALGPKATEAQWDDELGVEMRRCNRAIDEEAVTQALLQDLNAFA